MKRVVSAWKTGGYGTTMWHHELECGHVASSRRRAPEGKMLECRECLDELAGARRIASLPDPEETEPLSHAPETAPGAEPDGLASQLEWVSMAAAVIAAELRIPREQVEVVVSDDGSLAGGRVILTPSDVAALLRRTAG